MSKDLIWTKRTRLKLFGLQLAFSTWWPQMGVDFQEKSELRFHHHLWKSSTFVWLGLIGLKVSFFIIFVTFKGTNSADGAFWWVHVFQTLFKPVIFVSHHKKKCKEEKRSQVFNSNTLTATARIKLIWLCDFPRCKLDAGCFYSPHYFASDSSYLTVC